MAAIRVVANGNMPRTVRGMFETVVTAFGSLVGIGDDFSATMASRVHVYKHVYTHVYKHIHMSMHIWLGHRR